MEYRIACPEGENYSQLESGLQVFHSACVQQTGCKYCVIQHFYEVSMFTRRQFSLGLATAPFALSGLPVEEVLAHHSSKYKNFKPKPEHVPQRVKYSGYPRGTIVVDPHERYLYLMEGFGRARRYGVGVGKAALAWSGTARIKRKAEWPSWTPTANMIKREPQKYARYAKGVPGGPKNPLGARALYLFEGNRDTYYRIHGTTQPWTIGTASSNGCIRMINEHVIDLYERVPIGTKVIVL